MKRVYLDGEVFTVNFETTNAFGGEPGVLYYEFMERPGELFKSDRTRPMDNDYDVDDARDCIQKQWAEEQPVTSPTDFL
jgi:hypothetical protein